jgi:hypothetical protein
MGLIPASEVQPHLVMQDFQLDDFDYAAQQYIISGRLDTVTIEEIIDSQGFRLATVVVSPEPLVPEALTYFDRQSAFVGSEEDHDFAFSAATGYRASLDTRLGLPVATAVLANTESQPESFLLAQNYPNPFNSSTIIRFVLQERAQVELAVYNSIGQHVARLVQGVREAGTYAVSWDGRRDGGGELASGLYVYRLQAGAYVETRNLLLLR